MAERSLPERLTEPPGGWETFAGRHWRRSPAHYRRTFDGGLLDVARVHRILLRVAAADARDEATNVRVYVDKGRRDDLAAWLPRRDDPDLLAWARRLRRPRAGRDLTVVVNGCSEHDHVLDRRARRFLRGLGAHAPLSMWHDLTLYVSEAPATVFGIHADAEDNFVFMVHGEKRFRVWPKGARHARHRSALTFDVTAGDLLYIPAGCRHVATAARGLSVHVSLQLGNTPSYPATFVAEVAARLVAARLEGAALTSQFRLEEAPSGAPRLPPSLATVLDAYASLEAPLRRAVAEEWAARCSALGFQPAPRARPRRALADRDRLVVEPSSRLIIYREGKDAVVAANGHAYRFPAHPRVVRMIEEIRDGREATVGEWVSECRGTGRIGRQTVVATGDFVRVVLGALYRVRAIDVTGRRATR